MKRTDAPSDASSARESRHQLLPAETWNLPLPPTKPRLRSDPRDQTLTVSFLMAAVRRWWKVALPIGLILACLGAVGARLLSKPQYRAAAWLRIEEKTPFLAFETRNEDRSRAFFQTQVELIRSPMVLELAAKRPAIADIPELTDKASKIGWLSKWIQVAPVGESELFKIEFLDSDPRRAADAVNAVTDAYFRMRDQSDDERTRFVLELLRQEKEGRTNEVLRLREELRNLARQVTERNPLAAKTESGSNAEQSLADLRNRLIMAQVDGAVLEAKIKAAEAALSAPKGKSPAGPGRVTLTPHETALRDALVESRIEENPEVKRQGDQILAQQKKLREIEVLATQGAKDPDYLQLQTEIARARQVLEGLRARVRRRVEKETEATLLAKRSEVEMGKAAKWKEEIDVMRSELRGQEILKQRIEEEYHQTLKDAKQASGDTLLLEFKREELSRAERVMELISQRVLQLQTERGAPARVSLLKLAEPPVEPTFTARRNMLLAALAGLCVPMLALLGWERIVRRVGELQDLERRPSLAVLGEIARLPAQSRVIGVSGGARLRSDQRLFEESIDSLRTRLTLCGSLKNMRFLAVTSAINHEGKTSVASQLAISMAQATGDPVLLVDGDLRSPDVHRLFGVSLEPGLASVLSGECALDKAIVLSARDHVSVLPAGRLRANPFRLLSNGTWKALLEEIPGEYRYVIIDTPPILVASESLILARAADAAIVCAMRDISRVDQVTETCDRLAAAGGRPVGMVLNGVPGNRYAARYGYYAYSGD
ncbi:MAG: polysaccharide biosynthesis tyrosine autokinase [Pirellulales bacterium]|nr:polysaccharide biosynthesis tyrosine autokinase [Pirellulales bacterium]